MQGCDIDWTHRARVRAKLFTNGANAVRRREIRRRRRFVGAVATVACFRNRFVGSERYLGRIHVRDNDEQRNKQVGHSFNHFLSDNFLITKNFLHAFLDTIITWDSFPSPFWCYRIN